MALAPAIWSLLRMRRPEGGGRAVGTRGTQISSLAPTSSHGVSGKGPHCPLGFTDLTHFLVVSTMAQARKVSSCPVLVSTRFLSFSIAPYDLSER